MQGLNGAGRLVGRIEMREYGTPALGGRWIGRVRDKRSRRASTLAMVVDLLVAKERGRLG